MSTAFAPQAPDQVGMFTVEQVTQRSVNKRDGTSFTMYEIRTAENPEPFQTTKRPIAESAHELIGRAAELHYNVKVNGEWTNFYVNSILPAPLNPVERAQMAQEAQPVLRAAAGLPSPQEAAQTLREASGYPTPKDRSIFRQTAAKVAAVISPTDPLAFWENVEKLAAYFETGQTSAYPNAVGDDGDDIPF